MTKLVGVLILAGSTLLATTRYLSPAGSDANSCTTSSRCKSINRAYQLSTNGDIILMAAGTYSDVQTLTPNGMGGTFNQTPVTANVVTVRPESGAVTIAGDLLFGDSTSASPIDHLAFEDITVSSWMQIKSGRDIHFTRVKFMMISQWNCADNISVQNSEYGPFTSDYGDALDLYGGIYGTVCNGSVTHRGNWLIETSSIHGISTNVSTAHPDAFALDDGDNVVIRRNKFYNNCGDDIRISSEGPPTNIVLQNNYFGPPVSCAAGAATTVQVVNVGTIVSYNTFDGDVQMGSPDNLFDRELWEGNIITGQVAGGCPIGAGTIARYNVWSSRNSASCGANNVRVNDFSGWFVNPSIAAGDYRLTSAAALAVGAGNPSSYPAVDVDGNSRGSRPDAGASQFSVAAGGVTAPNPPTNLTSLVR
jgi:hypothetical protein